MIIKRLKILAIGIYAVGGGLLVLFAIPQFGWKSLSVATGSMTPAIPAGSLVLVHKVASSNLKTGNVITYINPNNTKQTITHRIIKVTTKLNLPAYITKGDANQTPDPEILGGNVVGKVEAHLPYIGRIISWAKQPLGLILLVIIPGVLIIIDELKRLVNVLVKSHEPTKLISTSEPNQTEMVKPAVLASQETEAPPLGGELIQPAIMPPKVALNESKLGGAPQPKPKRRSLDGIGAAIVIVGAILLMTHMTFATLNSSATLAGNTIAAAPKTNHLVISRVFLGGTGAVCPGLSNNSITIIQNGPGSTNNATIEANCNITITNSNNVSVVNSSSSTSQSGSTSSLGNTSGGPATSGNVSNSSSQSTSITINNLPPASTNTSQWFELYNPTSSSVNLAGWSIKDNSGTAQALPGVNIPARASVIIPASALGGTIGDGLSNSGDELKILNGSQIVDGLSWGNDVTILNPPVAAIPIGGSAKRINPNYDTDSANDWVVQGP